MMMMGCWPRSWQGLKLDQDGAVTEIFEKREATVAEGRTKGGNSWSLNVMMEVRTVALARFMRGMRRLDRPL
jgi:hypothetical protein